MAQSILEKLKKGVVLGDGGYLLALENLGYVQAGPFTRLRQCGASLSKQLAVRHASRMSPFLSNT
jgi:hypothetical protein